MTKYSLNDDKKVIAVDFDGTLCENKFPQIGEPNLLLIGILLELQKSGHKIVLWTCRSGEMLDDAINFCKSLGLEFDAVNSNISERIEKFGNDPRKIGADIYIDDKCVHPSTISKYFVQSIIDDTQKFTADCSII